jgi:hypothetical protein
MTGAVPCPCRIDEDGIVVELCPPHDATAHQFEWRVRRVLDGELDEVIRELAGRSPTRIERKAGAIGDFAIARRP